MQRAADASRESRFSTKNGLRRLACGAVAVWIAAGHPPAAASENTDPSRPTANAVGLGETAEVTPAHVYQLVGKVEKQIESLRLALGKPEIAVLPIRFESAVPEKVFFQAAALRNQAKRLSHEWKLTPAAEPPWPTGEIVPADVYRQVRATSESLRRVAARLGNEDVHELPGFDPDKTPTDAFNAIFVANRRLDHLLEKQAAPSDVYEQVTVALNYANLLRRRFPGRQIPPEPEFEPNQTPCNVYQQLLDCLQIIGRIAEDAGTSSMRYSGAVQKGTVRPGDVYSLAVLVVAELRAIENHILDEVPDIQGYYAGKKTPSHAFQRAQLLARQLEAIESLTQNHRHAVSEAK